MCVPDYREVLFTIDKLLDTLDDGIARTVDKYQMKLITCRSVIEQHSPEKTIALYDQLISACEEKINLTLKNKIDFYTNIISHYASKLEAISPLKVLARGYSIVEDDNNIPVKTCENLEVGDRIRVKTVDGEIRATVDEIILNSI